MLLTHALHETGIKIYILDLTNKLEGEIDKYAKLYKSKHTFTYININQCINRRKSFNKKELNKILNHFNKTDPTPVCSSTNFISDFTTENNIDLSPAIKQVKEDYLKIFLIKLLEAIDLLNIINPSIFVYACELDFSTRAYIAASNFNGLKVISMQHCEGNGEEYEQLPILADYYLAYSPYNCKKLIEMGVGKDKILFSGMIENDKINTNNINIRNLYNHAFPSNDIGKRIDSSKYTILIALKPNNTKKYIHLNKKVIRILVEFSQNNPQIVVLIKLHPNDKDDIQKISIINKQFISDSIFLIKSSCPLTDLLKLSNLFITFNSSSIVDSHVINTRTIVIDEDDGKWPDWDFYKTFNKVDIKKLELEIINEFQYYKPLESPILPAQRELFLFYFRYKFDKLNGHRMAQLFLSVLQNKPNITYFTQQKELDLALNLIRHTPHKR